MMPLSKEFEEGLGAMFRDPEQRTKAAELWVELAKVGLRVAIPPPPKTEPAPVMQQFNFDTKGRTLLTGASEGEGAERGEKAPAPPIRVLSAAPPESHGSSPVLSKQA